MLEVFRPLRFARLPIVVLAGALWTGPATGQNQGQGGAAPQPVERLPNSTVAPAGQPGAPFQLNAQQQQLVDQVLDQWEAESAKVRTFTCPFERLEYDPVFMKNGQKIPVTKSQGLLRYARPDKGLFKITEVRRYDPKTGDWKKSDEPDEHWVCDGTAVYEFDAVKKQMIVRLLPPEYQGKAIADGPLPFLFNAEARKLKQRYFIRVTRATDTEIWLDVYPRRQHDAANYRRVEMILDRHRFLPSAVQVFLPNNKNRVVYVFRPDHAKVNDTIERLLGVFKPPRTPIGWKKVIERIPAAPPRAQAARPPREPGPAARR
ncbi:MAG: TIGR03009 domain-containing protein [Planctomycetia bacterium]|nr:MAG: TIGR03009 domain-containing protein [Planctomycetia bacterium]